MSQKNPSNDIPEFVKKGTTNSADTGNESPNTAALAHATYEELEEMLNDATAELETQKAQNMRMHAELDNVRKRAENDIRKAHQYGLDRFAMELLPVIDSLERGLTVTVDNNELAKSMQDGLAMTRDLFLTTLEKFSIKPVDPLNQSFNPELHQAISMEEQKDIPANTVIKVLQKGYTLNDRLIRPALVIVSKS